MLQCSDEAARKLEGSAPSQLNLGRSGIEVAERASALPGERPEPAPNSDREAIVPRVIAAALRACVVPCLVRRARGSARLPSQEPRKAYRLSSGERRTGVQHWRQGVTPAGWVHLLARTEEVIE